MLRNNLIIAWRNLWKNKTFSSINIFGLSLGIAAFLLIVNYLRFEYSYDDFNVKKDRIYRVPMEISEKGEKAQTFAFTFPAVAPALKKDYPEIEETVRFRRQGGVIRHDDQKIVEPGTIYYVDPSIFTLFSFPFQKGKAATAFLQLNDAVITESAAKKYFGNVDPIGKSLHYRDDDYTVTAILKDIPANSHIQFNVLFNFNKYIQLAKKAGSDAQGSWGWSDYYTYVLLKPGTDAKKLQSKLSSFAVRYLGDEMKKRQYSVAFTLQPLKDIHLHSKYDYELQGNGDLTYLKYLGIAALFILFIAWINYVNLSTARSIDRSKEVGVRKVIGANKFQLIRQFLTESFLINVAAIAMGVIIFEVSLPYFSTLVQKNITDLQVTSWKFWTFVLSVFVFGSLFAGFYPSFILSSFKPLHSLKSTQLFSFKSGKNILRKSLVVIQFTAAIVLIAGALGFYRQLNYMSKRDLGVNISQTLVVEQSMVQDSTKISAFHSFVNELKSHPGIISVTASTSVPGSEVGGSAGFSLLNSNAEKRCRILGIDNNFIPDYGLSIVAGRNFVNDKPAVDTSQILNIILNETAAKVFGFQKPGDIIGRKMTGAGFTCQVVGIVKDYHQESLHHSFDPIVFYPEQETGFEDFSIKLNTKDLPGVMHFVKQKWNVAFPESPFNFFFVGERFNNQYQEDRLFSTVLWLFTFLALIVACLGLFGLSLYTVSKRSKEIGIRKVLGATLLQITSLITRDYMKLVIFAGVLAIPVAWLLLNNWLKDYAFHINIGWWFFILPFMIIIIIALLTVSYQSLKAAVANPVNSLRME